MKCKWFLVILFIFFSSLTYAVQADNAPTIVNSKVFKLDKHDYVYGKEDAPITVLEYFSLTCPHCENFFVSIFPKIKKEYIDAGKVKWVKRSYAMDNSSQKGTLLLYCVTNDSYEKFLSILLTKQASWAYQKDPVPILRNIATLGGMSVNDFNQCITDKLLQGDIMRIVDEGKNILKISGTPSFYINQEKVTFYNYKSFQNHFDKILKNK